MNFDVLTVKIVPPAHELMHRYVTLCFEICMGALGSNRDSESAIHGRFGDYFTNFDVLKVKIVAPVHELMHRYVTLCFEICMAAIGFESRLRIGDPVPIRQLFTNFDVLTVKIVAPAHELKHK